MEEKPIKIELAKLRIKCEKIITIKKKDSPEPAVPVRLVTFANGTYINAVRRISILMYTKIKWEQ